MKTIKEKQIDSFSVLKEKFGYKNKLSSPHITKVIVSCGTGTMMKKDRNKNDFVMDRMAKITGQKPSLRSAKQSIASFKIRQGDKVGVSVTLRGSRMFGFLDKLFYVAIPRTKDFRGIDKKGVDSIGNITISVKEHTIFPETADEDIKDVFGLAITIVKTAKNKEKATEFFSYIGVP